MSNFPTPRLLLELRRQGVWKAVKIYCDYKDVRSLLNVLPKIATEYRISLHNMRIKNLLTRDAIADAKLAVYQNEQIRRKPKS